MLALRWGGGLIRRRPGRMAGATVGVALAVALLASLGAFLSSAKGAMARRAAATVSVDWQVEAQPGADAAAVLSATAAAPGVVTAVPVGYGETTGLQATTGGTTQTTGPGTVLGLPDRYGRRFPGAIRILAGAEGDVLLAQQTAANLHAGPGDRIAIGRAGMPPVEVTVEGVVDLPQADSLFQRVGAGAGAQRQAPPDNVVVLPEAQWHTVFDPLAAARPDLVRAQVHARLDRRLPPDPAAAFTAVSGRARHLEAGLAGAGLVGDNLAATLDTARSDALYAEILFLLLGLPGAVLAGLLTRTVTAAGASRRRRELALLRTRGATPAVMVGLASVEAVVVGAAGSAVGLAAGALVGRLAFGSSSFGASTREAVLWALAAAAVGWCIAVATVVIPARRDARAVTVAAARTEVSRTAGPRPLRYGLDLWLLVGAGTVFWLAGRSGYNLVLAPEGVPGISVSYWALAGPLLLWLGAGLLAWRAVDGLLGRRRRLVSGIVRPVAGRLRRVVAAALSRQRRPLATATVLLALAVGFAASTAIFNATYRHQVDVDARLTNGADVTVTESPAAGVPASRGIALAAVAGVRHVEPLVHRFAYVGADLQDLFGVDPRSIVGATSLQDAYFAGGSARALMARLARQPDAVLVSAETVHDFQLTTGDLLRLRLRDSRSGQLVDVPFHYVGVAKEFPTAPRDSFLVANRDYVAARTGDASVGAFLVDTADAAPSAVARHIRAVVGRDAIVADIGSSRRLAGSSLTAVDLGGLTRVELGFGLALAAAAAGLVVGLGLAERRRALAITAALGATPRQLGAFVRAEVLAVTSGGVVIGALAAWALAGMLAKVLTGVFDPPPSRLAIPWTYLAAVLALSVITAGAAAESVLRHGRHHTARLLREV